MSLFKRNKPIVPAETEVANHIEKKTGFFGRLRQGLHKTRANFTESLSNLVRGKKAIDAALLEEIETVLLTADVGVEATQQIIRGLTDSISRKQLADAESLWSSLAEQLTKIVEPVAQPLPLIGDNKPFVILTVGVNGVGKTTTIGKLAKWLQSHGKRVMLAAGDTFRAAAIEQLQVWGERNQIAVVAQHSGADSASVIYDAFEAARARDYDVLIADTAGRLHTKDNLMQELQKIKKVLSKLEPDAPHEIMLVLDAGTGQNGLQQAQQFHQAMNLSGLVITKLDGTAKGGIVFAIAQKLKLPIRFIGVGEGIEDLRPFNAREFVNALLGLEETNSNQ